MSKLSSKTITATITGGYVHIIIPDESEVTGFKSYRAKLEDFVGGAAEWGAITGTLSDQTDLMTALNNKIGGTLIADTDIDLDGYTFTISGDDSEIILSVYDTVNDRTAAITINSSISVGVGEHSVVLESTGISVSNPVKIEGFSLPPGNDSEVVTTTTVYYTDVDIDNLPDTTLAGILEAFYIDSSNAQLIYTTYTDGQIEIWGREKADGTWADWAQISGGTLDHAALTSNLAFTDSGHTGTANTIAGFDGSGDATEISICSTIVEISTNTTLDASHNGTIIEATGTITITFDDDLPEGMHVDIVNVGTGVITLAAATTLQSKDSAVLLESQYGGASVYNRGSDVWLAVGDLT